MNDIEKRLIDGLNEICDEQGDEYAALVQLMNFRLVVDGRPYGALMLINKVLGTNVTVETSGDGDNVLVGFA